MLALFVIFISLGQLYRGMLKQPETRALLLTALGVLVVGIVFYVSVEHWSLLDSFYFCIVTLATVGYGDITPKTDIGKLFTSFYIIVGVAILGGFFATASKLIKPGTILRREKEHVEEDLDSIEGKSPPKP